MFCWRTASYDIINVKFQIIMVGHWLLSIDSCYARVFHTTIPPSTTDIQHWSGLEERSLSIHGHVCNGTTVFEGSSQRNRGEQNTRKSCMRASWAHRPANVQFSCAAQPPKAETFWRGEVENRVYEIFPAFRDFSVENRKFCQHNFMWFLAVSVCAILRFYAGKSTKV